MKGYIQSKNIVLTEPLPEQFRDGDEVEIAIVKPEPLPDDRDRVTLDEELAIAAAIVDELELGWDEECQQAAITDWEA
mgnify:CR=1 FL=1